MHRCRRFIALLLAPCAALAQPSPTGYSYVDTPEARLIYLDSLEYLVPHALQTFTNSLNWQKHRFGWKPSGPITLFLRDTADYGTGRAVVAPRLRLMTDVAPESRAFETATASERFYSTMNHEMVHIVQGDVASATDRRWRGFFGGPVGLRTENPETILYSYLTVPRFIAPRWYIEGGAVFMETWMSGGLGRAQGGYDEMVFRAMVRDGAPFYNPLGLASRGSRSDFQAGVNAYLYGTRFLTWLALEYSPQKVVDLYRRDEGSGRYYADHFEHVFGTPLDAAWGRWIEFEQQFQRRNLAEVRKFPITAHKPLVNRPIGSVSRVYFDEAKGTLYGGFKFPGVVDQIGALDTRSGEIRRLADIERAMLFRVTSFAFDPKNRLAFYTNDNSKYRDLMAVNVDTGEIHPLLEDSRIGEVVFNPVDRSLIGVRHSNGLATLVRVPYPYADWEKIHEFPYENVPSDLDISPDGRLLSATVGEVNTEQYLRVWELDRVLKGDLKPISQFSFGQSVPESFVFSRDSKYLYGSSYYTGVSNIFRYEVATGDVVAVSNADIGYFRPVPLDDGRLLVLTYTGEGFVPATIDPQPLKDASAIRFLGAEVAAKHKEVTTWQVPVASTVDPAKLVTGKGHYHPLRSVTFENAYPVLQGYKNYGGIGYQFNFSDPLAAARVGVTVAYTPSTTLPQKERLHFEVTGNYLDWRASIAHNKSDFYDLFGPVKRSRKGDAVNIGYDDSLVYNPPRELTLKYDLKYRRGIDTLPEAQNVGVAFTKMVTAQVGLHYTDLRKSLGAVEDEKGLAWAVVANTTRVAGKNIPQVVGEVSVGQPLPLAHSSVWLHGAAGATRGDPRNPVASFYFGGFGNNYVDSRAIKRYHEFGSMPGFEIDEIAGQRFVKSTVEVNLPPVSFDSAGWPGFHASWLRPSLFASSLWTDPGRATKARHTSVGAQADIRFSVMHWSELTLSVGYAAGFKGGKRSGNEFMVSLKVL
ncbi:MAG TPA: hypothetical protein VK996_15135 [Ramlibacter sp.]|nr:hypothetical protein [Ramlibacter sp.]